jgi:hypothetical protein
MLPFNALIGKWISTTSPANSNGAKLAPVMLYVKMEVV